jgi:hypothetical protein
MKQSLKLRLIVTDPLPDVHCAMQRGKSGLLPPIDSSDAVVFDFTVQVDMSQDPIRLTGEFTQGPPAKRFVYVNSGFYAGKPGASWSRRAKVPITGISAVLANEAISADKTLQARVHGRAKDGGPFCASVPLLSDWSIAGAA